MNRLTDERLNTLEFTAEECMDGQVRFDIMALCEELRARRVRDADLRALLWDWAENAHCRKPCFVGPPCTEGSPDPEDWQDEMSEDFEEATRTYCYCKALAHFGLAEPEAEK